MRYWFRNGRCHTCLPRGQRTPAVCSHGHHGPDYHRPGSGPRMQVAVQVSVPVPRPGNLGVSVRSCLPPDVKGQVNWKDHCARLSRFYVIIIRAIWPSTGTRAPLSRGPDRSPSYAPPGAAPAGLVRKIDHLSFHHRFDQSAGHMIQPPSQCLRSGSANLSACFTLVGGAIRVNMIMISAVAFATGQAG